ncbi:hypothetical protein GCM10022243_17320 [Saccharothrix violaceirubra]|uniref:Uncharacterized protein n=1 Tax=Saccharothrix violaceirubra TaxID=413306 RepID=A0A7W7SZ20_9PSEU|nr:hypothetical protein [Saccharothrix violaceirubra]MBB4963475.1 hypothetical protein [Saccharothrix violaceirubra]
MPSPLVAYDDPDEAAWLVGNVGSRRRSATGDLLTTVGMLVPRVFPVYLRVLFPFDGPADEATVSWREVAARAGIGLTVEMSCGRLWDALSPSDRESLGRPWDGHQPPGVSHVLSEVLARHTTTPGRCVFAVWDGRGGLAEHHTSGTAIDHHGRIWFLNAGTVADAPEGLDRNVGDSRIPPDLWWPADHAWFAGTDLDSASSYVGCGEEAARALAAAGLELLPVRVDDLVA